jgi:hypothetical protein
MSLWTVALLVFLINLPFGYWRASVRKLSAQWFLAVHLPVPLIVALRIYSDIGWKLASFPVLVGAFFLGQFVGGRLRNIIQGRGPGRAHH